MHDSVQAYVCVILKTNINSTTVSKIYIPVFAFIIAYLQHVGHVWGLLCEITKLTYFFC